MIDEFIKTIITEMGKGNFSFLILVVGALQVVIMVINLVLLIISVAY